MQKKLYVLISNKLNPIYGCVQAGHGVAQWLLDNPKQNWNNQYLIYLTADLSEWLKRLTILEKEFSTFHEPDLDGELTAIAVTDSGKLFKNLKLVS